MQLASMHVICFLKLLVNLQSASSIITTVLIKELPSQMQRAHALTSHWLHPALYSPGAAGLTKTIESSFEDAGTGLS